MKANLNHQKSSRFELKSKKMQSELEKLFEQISTDKKLEHEFIQNPSKVISEKVMKNDMPKQQLSEANRLLFSLISNDKMLSWLNQYSESHKNKEIDNKKFALEFAKAVVEVDDKNIVISIVNNAALGFGIPGFTNNAYQCVCNEKWDTKPSCACTPVSKDNRSLGPVTPETLRAISEHLITHAKTLNNIGQLSNLDSQIGF